MAKPVKPKGKRDMAAMRAAEREQFELEKDLPAPRRVGRPRLPVREVGQVYTVRIPVGRLEELRLVAEEQGKKPTQLMREWILERLDDAEVDEVIVHAVRARNERTNVTELEQRRRAPRPKRANETRATAKKTTRPAAKRRAPKGASPR